MPGAGLKATPVNEADSAPERLVRTCFSEKSLSGYRAAYLHSIPPLRGAGGGCLPGADNPSQSPLPPSRGECRGGSWPRNEMRIQYLETNPFTGIGVKRRTSRQVGTTGALCLETGWHLFCEKGERLSGYRAAYPHSIPPLRGAGGGVCQAPTTPHKALCPPQGGNVDAAID